ncbi:MAG: triose-phosphate isomerase [Proteobacteria bacterium]|nr:triose-phosphate isomerase [Pseudomonadota bacterium]
MKRYIVANWKCHKSGDEGRRWFDRFASLYKPHPEVQVVVAPSLLCLENLAVHVHHLGLVNVFLAVQDISPFPRGGYTGVLSGLLLALARQQKRDNEGCCIDAGQDQSKDTESADEA